MEFTDRIDVDTAIDAVTAALQAQRFKILTRIEVRRTLKEKLAVDTDPQVILGFSTPALAKGALQADLRIASLHRRRAPRRGQHHRGARPHDRGNHIGPQGRAPNRRRCRHRHPHCPQGRVRAALHGAGRVAGAGTLPTVAVHSAAMLATDSVLLRAGGLTGAPWTWGQADLATIVARAGVHAVLTAVVWSVLRIPSPTRS